MRFRSLPGVDTAEDEPLEMVFKVRPGILGVLIFFMYFKDAGTHSRALVKMGSSAQCTKLREIIRIKMVTPFRLVVHQESGKAIHA